MLIHLGSPILILSLSLLALNWQSLHLSQISPQYLSVHVQAADVRNLFVSFIMIPEVFYEKHIMHAWLVLNLGLPWETNNFEFHKTNDFKLLSRYSTELHANQAAGQEYLRRCV